MVRHFQELDSPNEDAGFDEQDGQIEQQSAMATKKSDASLPGVRHVLQWGGSAHGAEIAVEQLFFESLIREDGFPFSPDGCRPFPGARDGWVGVSHFAAGIARYFLRASCNVFAACLAPSSRNDCR